MFSFVRLMRITKSYFIQVIEAINDHYTLLSLGIWILLFMSTYNLISIFITIFTTDGSWGIYILKITSTFVVVSSLHVLIMRKLKNRKMLKE